MRKTWVQSLGCEDPLEKGKACTPVFWPGEFQRLSLHFTMHSWPEFQGPTRGAAVHLPVYMNGAAAGVQAHPAQLYWYMVVLVKRWVCVCVCLFIYFFGVRLWPKSLQLYLSLCDPMDCSPSSSSVHGILQANPSWPRNQTGLLYYNQSEPSGKPVFSEAVLKFIENNLLWADPTSRCSSWF